MAGWRSKRGATGRCLRHAEPKEGEGWIRLLIATLTSIAAATAGWSAGPAAATHPNHASPSGHHDGHPSGQNQAHNPGSPVLLSSTAYCQGDITAAGHAPFVGEVASNIYPLGTRLAVSPPVWGRTRFVVLDRIGSGSQLDFFTSSCSQAIAFGRRVERVMVVK